MAPKITLAHNLCAVLVRISQQQLLSVHLGRHAFTVLTILSQCRAMHGLSKACGSSFYTLPRYSMHHDAGNSQLQLQSRHLQAFQSRARTSTST